MSAFLQPWMLWGLGLAGVPVIIHFLNRRRYRTVRWAAMEFLRSAFRKNQRRLRFENLLLLLIRTALIVLLVLALARPFLAGAVAEALSPAATHYTVVLDNSWSMGFNEGVTSPFERAQKEALKIAGAMGPEDSVTLYLTNDDYYGSKPGTPRAVLRDSHDPEKLRTVLGRIDRPSYGTAGVAAVLSVVADELDARTAGRRVVLITDMQRRAWESEPGGTGAVGVGGAPESGGVAGGDVGGGDVAGGEIGGGKTGAPAEGTLTGSERTIRDVLEAIERKGATFHLVDVGARDPANAAVVALTPEGNRPLVVGNPEKFTVRLANYDRRPAPVDVTWFVDGQLKGSRRVELPAAAPRGEPKIHHEQFTFPSLDEAGYHAFSARIATDGLTVDDVRIHASRVRDRIRVLAVDGDPSPKPGDGQTSELFYVKPAIAWMNDRIELEVVDYLAFLPIRLDERAPGKSGAGGSDVGNWDLLILANVQRLGEEKSKEIAEFVRRGGALVVFLGNQVEPGLLNHALWRDGDGPLPAEIPDVPVLLDPAGSKVHVDLDAPTHPLLDPILGPEGDPEDAWRPPPIWGYFRVEPPADDPDIAVLLRLKDAERSPFLVERDYGKGKVFLFTTSADMQWGALPAPGVMTILLHEMVYYLTAPAEGRSNLRPFATFARELPERVEDVTVTRPGNAKPVKVPPITREGGPAHIEYADTEDPGVYTVHYRVRGASAIDAGRSETSELFAVNVDPREGDLRRIEGSELEERYAGLPLNYARGFSGTVDTEARDPEGEIWKVLLAAVLALLFLEILLARRFGDASRRVREEQRLRKGAASA